MVGKGKEWQNIILHAAITGIYARYEGPSHDTGKYLHAIAFSPARAVVVIFLDMTNWKWAGLELCSIPERLRSVGERSKILSKKGKRGQRLQRQTWVYDLLPHLHAGRSLTVPQFESGFHDALEDDTIIKKKRH